MKKPITLLKTLLLLLVAQVGVAQTVDCFIIDNPTNSTVDVYVVANGGSFTSEQWNDMVITLSVPIANSDLGPLNGPPVNAGFGIPGVGVFPSSNNTYTNKGWILAKQPTNVGNAPSFSSATKDYYAYAFAGLVTTFALNVDQGQDAALVDGLPVLMGSIPKNGNAFADIEIYPRSFIQTDALVLSENASFYIEINNLEKSGEVYKEDIIHFNNRLNQFPVNSFPNPTPYPDTAVWRGGSDATAEPDLTDGTRNLTIYAGPVVKTMIGEVNNTEFKTVTNIEIAPNAGFKTATITKANAADADSVMVKADTTGYGQYIGPSIAGRIQQYVGTTEGWRNISFPIAESSTSVNGLSFGGAPMNFNTASTSYHASTTPGACGDFGNWINTVNVYEFLGTAGPLGSQGDHEWYGANPAVLGGNKGYSIFLGGSNFPTSGIISVKGMLQDASVADYPYSNQVPHAIGTTGASQQNWAWSATCAPLQNEPAADRKNNWDGWVLVANPFPSGLDVDAFCTTNGITNTDVRVWDRTGDPYQIASGANPDYAYSIKAGQIIPPMQGFFVKTGNSGDIISLSFLESHRAFSTASFQKTAPEEVVLIAMNTADSATNHAILDFEFGATKNYDMTFDSYVLSQPGSTTPQIGFHYESTVNVGGSNKQVVSPLYKNTVNDNVAQDSYPLRFWSRTAGNFEFRLDQTRLNPSWKIYIEDTKTAPGVSTEITNTSYSFSYVTSDSPTRFILHFVNTAFGVEENIVTDWAAQGWFNASEQLVVSLAGNNLPKSANVRVFDVAGKLLYEANNVETDSELVIQNNFASGIYMIIVEGSNGENRFVKVMNNK